MMENKEKRALRFMKNLGLYLIIGIGLYLLYSPLNKHPHNQIGSAIQFVYQQF